VFVNVYFSQFRGLGPRFFALFCILHKNRTVQKNDPVFILFTILFPV